jgi:hypothetical protein
VIAEAAIVGATVIVVSSLRTANAMHKRELEAERERERALEPKPRLRPEALAEKRKILTAQRELWFASWDDYNKARPRDDASCISRWAHVERLDRELMALADQDAIDGD